MKVIIMRGIPGSGKSTWARENYPKAKVFSADQYFMDGTVYRFDSSKLQAAHNWCLNLFLAHLYEFADDYDDIEYDEEIDAVVDNTNIQLWQLSPYFLAAKSYGCDVRVVTMIREPSEAHKANVHGVPADTVWRMHHQLAPLEPRWNEQVVFVK